jgi:hypothetical protein
VVAQFEITTAAVAVVHLTSPTPGSTFAGGSVVPIIWTASAQQSGLRMRIAATGSLSLRVQMKSWLPLLN